ncbi:MAG TPA: DUF420 domain-containing protein [Clostridia bacterium]|nr:DUF420 domain-containing protein [Clostridia bacterium]
MTLADLPAVNAGLNALSTVFLTVGYVFIRRGNRIAHRNCMLAALITSALFLVSYLSYHGYVSYVLGRGPTIFKDPAWFRPYYLFILGTHTVMAMVIVPLALLSVYLGLKEKYERHKKVSRWTWPVWMYVSITGVLIYFLLYQIFPQHP